MHHRSSNILNQSQVVPDRPEDGSAVSGRTSLHFSLLTDLLCCLMYAVHTRPYGEDICSEMRIESSEKHDFNGIPRDFKLAHTEKRVGDGQPRKMVNFKSYI